MKKLFTFLFLSLSYLSFSQTLVTQGVGAVTNTTAEINVVLGVPAGETYTFNVGYVVAPGNPRTQGTNVNGPNITANPGVNGTKLTITGLTPNTTYNYSVVVQRAIPSMGGLLYYPDGSFTTKVSATPPLPSPIYDFGFNGNLASSVGSASLTPAFFPAGGSTVYASNGATANSAVRINSGITSTTVLSSNLPNIAQGISARTIAVRMAFTSALTFTNSVYSWGSATNNRAFGYNQTSATAGSLVVYGNDVAFTNNITNGTFFTLIVTYDGGWISIYKDGALVSTTARGMNTVGTTFKIGEDINGSKGLQADIDDLKIFNTVLTNTEVATLHQNMQPAIAPTITAISTAPISLTSYAISYTLNPNGQNTTSSVQFGLSRTNLATTLTSFSAPGNTPVSSNIGINGLSLNTKYYYQISATNSAGTTTTTVDSFTTQSSLAPSVVIPASNSVSNVRANSVTLNYILNANGAATTSVINYGTSASSLNLQSAGATASGTNGTNVSANLSSLNSNTLYYYTVTATNSVGSTTSSTVGNFTTNFGPTLSAISSTSITNNSADINYTLGTLGANNYAYVRYGTTATNLATASALHGPYPAGTGWNLTRNLAALNAGTQYFYQVVAYNGNNDSAFSAVQNFTTTSIPVPILSAVSTSAVAATTATVNYTVNANGSSTTTLVRYGTSAGSLTQSVNGTTATGSTNTPLTVNLTGLTASTQYFYSVEATNAGGNATPVTGNFTTTAAASVPTISNVGAGSIAATSFTVGYTINANGSNATPVVRYGTASNNLNQSVTGSVISGTTNTNSQVNLTGLTSGTQYFYRVEASNTIGNATPSVINNVTTIATLNAPTNGLIAYYGFNNTINSHDGNHNMTSTVAPTYVAGKVGNGVSFSNSVNNTLINNTLTNALPSNGNFTICFWRKNNLQVSTPGFPTFFEMFGSVFVRLQSSNSYQCLERGYAYNTTSAPNPPSLLFNTSSDCSVAADGTNWDHYAIVHKQGASNDPTKIELALYYNGVFRSEVVGVAAYDIYKYATGFTIGGGINSSNVIQANKRYDGIIDEFYVYNRVLTATEINNVRNETNGQLLPTTLSNFVVKLQNNNAQLSWQTSQEVNSSHFEVEYSVDGNKFEKVLNVSAKGNSNQLQNYAALHEIKAHSQSHYYRLKMIDADGKFTYSQIVQVKTIGKNLQIQVYPTVVNTNATVNIQSTEKGIGSIHVRNMQGQLVQHSNVNIIAGSVSQVINMSNFSKGTYLVTVQLNNQQQNFKVIKQ